MSWRSVVDWYFAPCRFELWRDGRIYELIGIRLFKKYLPTSGDLVSRWQGVRRIAASGTHRTQSLLRHQRFTKEYEIRHLVGGIVMLGLSLASIMLWQKGNLAVLLLANLGINGYPMMLQRYNRIRLLRILDRIADVSHSSADPQR